MKDVIRLEHIYACDRGWDNLTGKGRKRYCSECDRHLHNLSLYTERQAHKLATELLQDDTFCAVFEIEGDQILFKPEEPRKLVKFVGAAALAIPLLAACDDRPEPVSVPAQEESQHVEGQQEPGAAALSVAPETALEADPVSIRRAEEMTRMKKHLASEVRSELFQIFEGEGPNPPRSTIEEIITRDRVPRQTVRRQLLGVTTGPRD